ncbi:hypothetical protein F4677DRAFT_429524 [Hypoxylon crocopeplum]|nr:hypothetical protein F4677DRAFT_429524 [Hypoxylon crocopeplum]
MAIIEDVPGVEVVVQIGGSDAVEYDDPNPSDQEQLGAAEHSTVSKYIECVDNAEFTVKARITGDYEWGYRDHELCVRFYVDGKFFFGQVLGERHLEGGLMDVYANGHQSYCTRTKQWLLQRCKFSPISTVDDSKKDRVKSDLKIAKDLGFIEAKVFRCIYLGLTDSRPSSVRDTKKFELAEKSLKGRAMSHGTSFSLSTSTKTPNRYCNVEELAEDNGPIAIFRFHYRSRDALRREMVIPRTPSPSPSPDPNAKPEIGRMSRAELERLAGERLNQLQGGGRVKRERTPIIKRELGEIIDLSDENARPTKRRASKQPVEVIDLTDY